MWSEPHPSSTRTLFYGVLANPATLQRALAYPRLPDVSPAVLALSDESGWHVRTWGQFPALVRGSRRPDSEGTPAEIRGCVFECLGAFIRPLEKFEGADYAPAQVRVTLARDGREISAWCYVWNGAEDELGLPPVRTPV